jgi:stearoyl-CoA desaturase (delta-9 desaturase)
VLWTGFSWTAVSICAVCYLIRMFGLGVGYHRSFAHRSFKTSRPVQFLLALLGSLSFQRGPIWWAETHRYHHRHADTPDDLHSPRHQGFLYSHSGWFADKKNRDTHYDKMTDLSVYPELVWFDRWYWIPMTVYALLLWVLYGVVGIVWGVCINAVILWHLTHWIQSFSHRFGGYRRWESADQSRNHFVIGLFTLGEWHNNHHHFPSSAQQGCAWWEIDIGYYLLRALARVGLVWDLRTPGERLRQEPQSG